MVFERKNKKKKKKKIEKKKMRCASLCTLIYKAINTVDNTGGVFVSFSFFGDRQAQ